MNYLILLTLLSQLIAVVYSFDCTSTSALNSYLTNRGGSLNSAKCVSVVLLDVTSPSILASPSCDALVVDSKSSRSTGLLNSARVSCPATNNIPVVFGLNSDPNRRTKLGSIYCVDSAVPESRLYTNVLDRALADGLSNILLPVIVPTSANFDSRVNNAAFQVRSWIMRAFGNNNMRCPFNIIVTATDSQSYNSVLHGFSKAFSRDQAAYDRSLQPGASQPDPIPTPVPTPVSLPRTQLLSDFNQYDGIACPTMKNLFTLLSETGDPYLSKYTSVTTQISLAFSDFTMGIHSCDAFIMESGTYKFFELMREMGLPFSSSTQESGITIRSTGYSQTPAIWYSSLKKVMYFDFYNAINEVDTYESLIDLIKLAYLQIFDFANKNRLSELLVLPFGLWNSRHSYSIQIITAAVEGLAAALNEFLLTNDQLHITILAETRAKFEVLVEQMKPYFMNLKTSETLLGTDTVTPRPPLRVPPRPSRPPPLPPLPQRPLGPLRPQQPSIRPAPQGTYLFDSDEECMSGTPVSEFIQSMYNGRISQPTTSNHFSLILSTSNPGIIGCGCLVVDVSEKNQLQLATKLGISAKECTSVGSSEIKVLSVGALNAYTMEPWMASITRVYCLNSTKFIYNSRVKAVESLYKKLLASAKYRCTTVLSPLLATSVATSESRNKEYVLQAVKSMDEFFSTSPRRDSLHVTFYEKAPEVFFLALDLFATYYLEYASSGGVGATLTSINQNWLSLNRIVGGNIIPEFRAPSVVQKKPKNLLLSVKKELTKRMIRTTTTTARPLRVPPPRPPLPKFTGNKDASRPAPSTDLAFTSIYYPVMQDFLRLHSKPDVNGLYSINYWVQRLTTFTSTSLMELSKRFYLTNSGPTDLENCKVLAVGALSSGIHELLRLIGHSYPSLVSGVTVLANRRYGDSTIPLTRTLSRMYLVNVDNRSTSSAYEEVIAKAVASSERQVVLPIFALEDLYETSRNNAEYLILQAIKTLITQLKHYNSSNLKVVIYEENQLLALLILETLINVFSGRTRI
ncbi:uncharacterized protein ELE39_001814 [Cryptosporidium sp. chipmunk genotype I]|uniref:uncharacterized protein n=1 Tax=Cryptosporidium sp. chipmunk genotype I TaxID=1280935 RepID=UPI00351A96C3|nr:hypothetical protein ELE39_001814 [Cryptosporidium sp. chipmunk genotype I]